jgi:hypothetical protein
MASSRRPAALARDVFGVNISIPSRKKLVPFKPMRSSVSNGDVTCVTDAHDEVANNRNTWTCARTRDAQIASSAAKMRFGAQYRALL